MKKIRLQRRTLALLAVIVPLLALFVYIGMRSGPLAPVAVTVVTVESRSLAPALFGIGTVEARHTYRIGPTFAGRVRRLEVNVGDRVKAGQVLGEMDPVDLDARVRSQASAVQRAGAVLREAQARHAHAQSQVRRYEQLLELRYVSEEMASAKRQELQVAAAALSAAGEDVARTRSDGAGLAAQQVSLRLVAPVDGIVTLRDAEPGTTIVAGQAVVEVIDPRSLWVNTRFDQISASGLAAGLQARIALRSRGGSILNGHVLRVEPRADAVTEETLAKVSFNDIPDPLPPIGELAEVTVELPGLAVAPLIPNAAVRREGNKVGVWQLVDGDLRFTPVKLGTSDLNGLVQVREGLRHGDRIVSYSEKALTARSRTHVVERIPGVTP